MTVAPSEQSQTRQRFSPLHYLATTVGFSPFKDFVTTRCVSSRFRTEKWCARFRTLPDVLSLQTLQSRCRRSAAQKFSFNLGPSQAAVPYDSATAHAPSLKAIKGGETA